MPCAAVDSIPKAQQRSSRARACQLSLGFRFCWQPTAREPSKDPPMIGNLFRAALCCFILGGSGATASAETLVLLGGAVYASPDAAPLPNAVIVTSGGVITAVGGRNDVPVPQDARVVDCTGKTVVAGFWNSHVHFTQAVWRNAASAPAAPLEEHMQEMLTRWGFTTVWDLGSDPRDSLPLRQRVNSGDVPGPNILFAGSIFPKGGHPVYLPAEVQLPEAATPDEATQMSRGYLGMGLDGIKLFTGAYMGDKPVVNMDVAIARPRWKSPMRRAGGCSRTRKTGRAWRR
jgi:hypothetical protein